MSSEPVLAAGEAGVAPQPAATRGLRLGRIVRFTVITLLVVGGLRLAGVDVIGWLKATWDHLSGVGIWFLVGACVCKTCESASNAAAYRSILNASYLEGGV